jgi:hypothetical protein
MMRALVLRLLTGAQIAFYLVFCGLWFKINFPFLQGISIPAVLPLGLFFAATVLRLLISPAKKRSGFRFGPSRAWIVPALLLLVAVAVRLPYLHYYKGTFNSDDVFVSLMAQHIAEGKPVPIYHYGQEYLGTPAYHVYAMAFKLFGFSNLAVAVLHVAFFLGFILFQYLIFYELAGSRKQAGAAALFYALPIGELLGASFFYGGNAAPYLCLGSLCLYLSLRVFNGKSGENRIPLIGFLMGFVFWLHPISYIFIGGGFLFLFLRYRWRIVRYLRLAAYFMVGFFPVILNEIGHRFGTANFLVSGEKPDWKFADKVPLAIRQLTRLFAPKDNLLTWACLILILLGMVLTARAAWKRKKFLPETVFVIWPLVFLVVYFFSKFSIPQLSGTRYLWPLYAVFPFLLFVPFRALFPRRAAPLMVGWLLLLVIFFNAGAARSDYRAVKQSHEDLTLISSALKETGKKYWAGEFWEVILLSGLNEENVVGWSYDHEDYFPYKLRYFNDGVNNNFLFFKAIEGAHILKLKDFGEVFSSHLSRTFDQGEHLIELLGRLEIPARVRRVADCWLIYDVAADVYPEALNSPIPSAIPDVRLIRIEESGDSLSLTFRAATLPEGPGFRLGVEIPAYSSRTRNLDPQESEFLVRIPAPPEGAFKIRYFLDYAGLRIPPTVRESGYGPVRRGGEETTGRIVGLSGFGPQVRVTGRMMELCGKKTTFRVDPISGPDRRLVFEIYSPFDFSAPYWYGRYAQEIEIQVNGLPLRSVSLRPGLNRIEIRPDPELFRSGSNRLSFFAKYHLPFEFAPLWKTSFLLAGARLD